MNTELAILLHSLYFDLLGIICRLFLVSRFLYVRWSDQWFLTRNLKLDAHIFMNVSTSSYRQPISDLLLVSRYQKGGGHSLIVKMLAAELDGAALCITQPNAFRQCLHYPDNFKEILMLTKSGYHSKANQLLSYILDLAPSRIHILTDPSDPVYLLIHNQLVKQSKSLPQPIFHHHADHCPSIGASITDFLHVDYYPHIYDYCRDRMHSDNILASLAKCLSQRSPLAEQINLTSALAHRSSI